MEHPISVPVGTGPCGQRSCGHWSMWAKVLWANIPDFCQIQINQGCNFAILSPSSIIAELISSLLQKIQTTWSKAILNQSKLRTYILLKTDHCAENYVNANLTRP